MNKEKYLNMQRSAYDREAVAWTPERPDPVVGSYHAHNNFPDYEFLFDGLKTEGKIALEYGCGPGRNIVKYSSRFKRIDGVDIGAVNLQKAKLNLERNGVTNYQLFLCDGASIPTKDKQYDFVFSVICLQHICVHVIRFSIMLEAYRVLKKNGWFTFQMGYGGKVNGAPWAKYFDNVFDAPDTNSAYDVSITNTDDLKSDLEQIGFRNFSYRLGVTGPGDAHGNWIWVRAQK
jgi:SAM-dependent methyltransferase